MNGPTCDLARKQLILDDNWRRHSVDCPDCRETLAVIEWMTSLADNTAVPRELPRPGFLLFKAQIQKRLLAARRVDLPIYAMTVVAGILLVAGTISLLSVEPRLASI